MKHLLTFLCVVFLHSSLSHASVTINVVETGGDVVATTSGSVNTDALIPIGLTFSSSGSFLTGSGFFSGNESAIGIGPNITARAYRNGNLVTDMVFSTISAFTRATSSTGDSADYFFFESRNDREDRIHLSTAYVSNSPLNATATWAGATFTSLELIPGTYNATWGSGATADSLTIIIGADTTNPTLQSSTPADNATGVSVAAPTLSLIFDEPVFPQSGVIRMYKTSDDSEVNNRSVTGSTGSGTPNISIGFENALEPDTEYYVLIPATAFDDAAGNSYAGFSSTTELSFTTAGAPTYSVEGTVSGLTALGLVLQNNGGDDLDVFTNGSFLFDTKLDDGSAYAVTVLTHPPGQTCSVTNGSGTIATANVTNVAVTCVTDVIPVYSVGGTVTGLTATGLALQNNGADTLAVAADGPFTFVTELTDGAAYAVTVSTQPAGQTCSVSNGSGTINTGDVTNVDVTCIDDVVPPVEPPAPAVPIPTLSELALILLSMLLGLTVFINRRRLF